MFSGGGGGLGSYLFRSLGGTDVGGKVGGLVDHRPGSYLQL